MATIRYLNISDKPARISIGVWAGRPPMVLAAAPGATCEGPGGGYIGAITRESKGALVPEGSPAAAKHRQSAPVPAPVASPPAIDHVDAVAAAVVADIAQAAEALPERAEPLPVVPEMAPAEAPAPQTQQSKKPRGKRRLAE